MSRGLLILIALTLGLALGVPSPALPHCSLCESLGKQPTIREAFHRAKLVALGVAKNPRLSPAANGTVTTGTTEFHILRIVKDHPALGETRKMVLPQYIPVLDAKSPPKILTFFDRPEKEFQPFRGVQLESTASVEYFIQLMKYLDAPVETALPFYFDYLDHPEHEVAADAFLEFAKATDADLAKVAPKLPIQALRNLVTDRKTPDDKRGLFAYILGCAGHPEDAKLLRALIEQNASARKKSLDGVLAGYALLAPEDGWNKVHGLLGDGKKDFLDRFSAFRVLKLFSNWQPQKYEQPILHGLRLMLRDPDFADMAIEHLRTTKTWSLCPEVLALYTDAKFHAPITKRAVLRFALSCPLPAAEAFVETCRQTPEDRALIEEVIEVMKLEQSVSSR